MHHLIKNINNESACGAYCKTCRAYSEESCRGCKQEYEKGERDITKAKCKRKVCCFRDKRVETCVDCCDYPCKILEEFWGKKGWKYQQYKKQLEFIRKNEHKEFLKKANKWK